MASDPLNLVGTTIAGKYAVEGVVGEGGFAIVYKAQHQLWKRPVAVKVFNALANVPEHHRDKLMQEFIREGALLAELSERSAAIVQARDIGMVNTPQGLTVPYMVLEWLEGSTLESVLAREREQGLALRTIEQTVKLLDAAAEALALAHARGIAHRDVKPANVFVLGDPRAANASVKLLDFGIAKVAQDAQSAAGEFAKTAGQPTSFTPAYGAPEQFNRAHGATGPWTDVFALALVVIETITGKPPLEGDDLVQLAFAAVDPTNRPTPRARGASVSDEVERVLGKAIAVAPGDRYQDGTLFWNALRAAVQMVPMRTSVSSLGLAATAAVPQDLGSAQTLAAPIEVSAPTALAPASTGTPSAPATPSKPPAPASRGRSLAVGIAVALAVAGGLVVFARSGQSSATSATSTTTSPSPPSVSSTARDASACPEGMVFIPAGEFFMGSDLLQATSDEKPAHKVRLSAYCIDAYEVTVARYTKCSDTGACQAQAEYNVWSKITDREREIYDPLCNLRDRVKRSNHPMNCVDWERANHYCQENGARLPTEAEWEYAALGPAGWTYPWGMEAPSAKHLNACGTECVAWGKTKNLAFKTMYDEDDGAWATAPVGSFPLGKTQRGLYDMVGNVWEWTADWYAPYKATPETDPHGPPMGEKRVVRGGAWNSEDPSWVRPTYRFGDEPAMRSTGIGFRCAKSAGP